MITIEVNNVRSRIIGTLDRNTSAKLLAKLSYELPGAFYAQRFNPWAGIKYLYMRGTQTFPTGLIHYVEQVLQKEGVQYQIIDCREPVTKGTELSVHGFTLRDYQETGTATCVRKGRGGIRVYCCNLPGPSRLRGGPGCKNQGGPMSKHQIECKCENAGPHR